MLTFPKLILASASPRRAEILRNAGLEFESIPAEINESTVEEESAEDYVQRLANEKALSVAKRLSAEHPLFGCPIVAADTTVSIEGAILGKPDSKQDARRMLWKLNGKWHEVCTGLAVVAIGNPRGHRYKRRARYGAGSKTWIAMEKTRVQFAKLAKNEIEEYVETDEPFGKAGAYAIQGRGGKFIPRIEGCYFNVMGLPLARLYSILRTLKV